MAKTTLYSQQLLVWTNVAKHLCLPLLQRHKSSYMMQLLKQSKDWVANNPQHTHTQPDKPGIYSTCADKTSFKSREWQWQTKETMYLTTSQMLKRDMNLEVNCAFTWLPHGKKTPLSESPSLSQLSCQLLQYFTLFPHSFQSLPLSLRLFFFFFSSSSI